MKCLFIAFYILLPTFSIAQVNTSSYQEQDSTENNSTTTSYNDKIFFGGSFWAGFSEETFVSISPTLGYKITPKLSLGSSFIYQYWKDGSYSTNDYGFRLIGIAKIYEPVYIQLEYEHLKHEYIDIFESNRNGVFLNYFAGLGIAQPLSDNFYATTTLLYNFTYEEIQGYYLPYSSPWVLRVGFIAGF